MTGHTSSEQNPYGNQTSETPDLYGEHTAEDSSVDLSIVIPARDEEATLMDLVAGIAKNMAQRPDLSFEIVFVDDGSIDRTWQIMTQLSETHTTVRAVRLRRNYGKAAAISAGVLTSRGRIIATMDADLQDDPAELPNMLAKLESGFDLVNGWKQVRHDPLSKTFPSKIFNGMMKTVFGLPLHDINCGFKITTREVFDRIPLYGEFHRFIPVLAHSYGYKVTEIPVQHHPRRAGKSKYGIERFLKGIIDMISVFAITRYRWSPGHLFGGLGLLVGLIGVLCLAILMTGFGFEDGVSTLAGILILSYGAFAISVLIFSIGIVTEFFIFHRNRPNPALYIAEIR